MKLGFYDFARIGHIKRWHNVNTIRSQTVAEHCFMVVLIALELYQNLVGIDRDEIHNGTNSSPMACELLTLVLGAIFHDAPETAAGDSPTPAKRLLIEITGDPELFKKLEENLMPELPYIGRTVPAALERMVEMADSIEAAHWIRDNGAGHHAEVVKGYVRRRMEDRVEKFHVEEPNAGWYEAVNKVLMALGMPFVHRESRLSPP